MKVSVKNLSFKFNAQLVETNIHRRRSLLRDNVEGSFFRLIIVWTGTRFTALSRAERLFLHLGVLRACAFLRPMVALPLGSRLLVRLPILAAGLRQSC